MSTFTTCLSKVGQLFPYNRSTNCRTNHKVIIPCKRNTFKNLLIHGSSCNCFWMKTVREQSNCLVTMCLIAYNHSAIVACYPFTWYVLLIQTMPKNCNLMKTFLTCLVSLLEHYKTINFTYNSKLVCHDVVRIEM